MPPINQEGSRAGLYTALVVFVIMFVVSSVLSFQFYGKLTEKQKELDDYKKQFSDIALQGAAQSPPVVDWLNAKSEVPAKLNIVSTDKAVDVAHKEIIGLASAITGTQAAASPASVVDNATKTLQDAQTLVGKAVTVNPGGLENAVKTLAAAVSSRDKSLASVNSELRDTKSQLAAAKKETADVNAQRDEQLKQAQANSDAALATAQGASTAANDTIKGIQDGSKAAADQYAAAAQQTATELATANATIAKQASQITSLKSKFSSRRADVINPIIRQVDAKIIRVPNNQVCYINLGFGDQVTPGLTFEVYDKADGVPPIPDNVTGDEQLPVGKASIEITHVGTTSSECRIVKLAPGAVLSEGDVIENLIYDPHTKYNFMVYGNFDLAGNGRPNAADADVMKRLVTQWGGKLTDVVNVDTDFLVLGAEPVLPNFSKDDLTAENQDKLAKAQDALNKYQEIENEAKELHIPILNQNRFLYYVGFYDQAKR
jgi:predicted  nucleic acid-binding Zn-ribbon protein